MNPIAPFRCLRAHLRANYAHAYTRTYAPSGTFAPITSAGKVLVVTLGSVAMVICAMCLDIFVSELDVWVNAMAKRVLRWVNHVRRACASRAGHGTITNLAVEAPPVQIRTCKLLVTTLLLHAFLFCSAQLARDASAHHRPNQRWGYSESYYYAFVTVSTIGFGDFALEPRQAGDMDKEMLKLHVQVLLIFVGLALFGLFIAAATEFVDGGHQLAATALHARLSASGFPCCHQWPSIRQVAPLPSSQPAIAPAAPPVEETDSPLPKTERTHLPAISEASGPDAPAAAVADQTAASSVWMNVTSSASRLLLPLFAMHCLMLLFGAILFYAESDAERLVACEALEEENELRRLLRLPPFASVFC